MPSLGIEVPTPMFDMMVRHGAWITDDDAWKIIIADVPSRDAAYALQIREAVMKRKSEGHQWMLLYSIRDERVQLLTL